MALEIIAPVEQRLASTIIVVAMFFSVSMVISNAPGVTAIKPVATGCGARPIIAMLPLAIVAAASSRMEIMLV